MGDVTAEAPASGRQPVHRRTITISTVVSILSICGVILPAIGVMAFPWFVSFTSRAVAGEIQTQVRNQVSPVNAAMRVLLEAKVAELEDEIAALEVRERRSPDWGEADAKALAAKKRALEANKKALSSMSAAEAAK